MTHINERYSSNIINLICDIGSKCYLELGIEDNTNFNNTHALNKKSVDTNGMATFTGTTDEYFQQLDKSESFDVIFIDANHDYDYVLRDFNNSIKHCKEWLVLHDMVPPSFYHTHHTQCSDSYRILYYIIKEQPDIIFYTLKDPIYCGLTFIRMPTNELNPGPEYKNTSYQTFMDEIQKHKLYSKEEMSQILGSK